MNQVSMIGTKGRIPKYRTSSFFSSSFVSSFVSSFSPSSSFFFPSFFLGDLGLLGLFDLTSLTSLATLTFVAANHLAHKFLGLSALISSFVVSVSAGYTKERRISRHEWDPQTKGRKNGDGSPYPQSSPPLWRAETQ